MIFSSCLRSNFPRTFTKTLIKSHSTGLHRDYSYPIHSILKKSIKPSSFLFAKESGNQIRWFSNEKNEQKDTNSHPNDELIQTAQQMAEDTKDKITEYMTTLKYDSRYILLRVIRSGIMGAVIGIIMGSCLFLFSLKSFTFLATSLAATTILMTCLGFVKGISRITDNIAGKDGPLYQFLSMILDYAFDPLKESDIADKIIPIEEYNDAVESTLRVIEDKLSMGNWFVKRFVKLFTTRIGMRFTRFTQGKEDISIGDSKEIVISIILEEIEGIIGAKVSYAVYAISFLQLIIIGLCFV